MLNVEGEPIPSRSHTQTLTYYTYMYSLYLSLYLLFIINKHHPVITVYDFMKPFGASNMKTQTVYGSEKEGPKTGREKSPPFGDYRSRWEMTIVRFGHGSIHQTISEKTNSDRILQHFFGRYDGTGPDFLRREMYSSSTTRRRVTGVTLSAL